MQSRKVFLSYRRDDSAAAAGRLSDRLVAELGDGSVFMDVDGIALGADFVKRLTEEVACCDTLLAIIGPRWLEAIDEAGHRRLDDPNDFVRVEIAAALQRDIPVIPILLDGTRIPRADRLPEDLKHLARRNGLEVRQASFHSDVGRLIRELKTTEVATAIQPIAVSNHVVAPERPPGETSRPDRLAGPPISNHESVVLPTPQAAATDRVAISPNSDLPAPAPSSDDQTPASVWANQVRRYIYGALLGSPVGLLISFAIFASIVSVPLDDWFVVLGLLLTGAVGLAAFWRRLAKMDILRASTIIACFATVLSLGISIGIVFAAGVRRSPAPLFLWPFVLLAMQGVIMSVQLRLRSVTNQTV